MVPRSLEDAPRRPKIFSRFPPTLVDGPKMVPICSRDETWGPKMKMMPKIVPSCSRTTVKSTSSLPKPLLRTIFLTTTRPLRRSARSDCVVLGEASSLLSCCLLWPRLLLWTSRVTSFCYLFLRFSVKLLYFFFTYLLARPGIILRPSAGRLKIGRLKTEQLNSDIQGGSWSRVSGSLSLVGTAYEPSRKARQSINQSINQSIGRHIFGDRASAIKSTGLFSVNIYSDALAEPTYSVAIGAHSSGDLAR